MEPMPAIILREIWNPDINVTPSKEIILRIIAFLNIHPELIQTNFNEVKPYFALIQKADLADLPDSAWKTYGILLNSLPNLFYKDGKDIPMVSIKMGNQEIEIPKNHVLARSEKFRKMFITGMAESQENCLQLDPRDYDGEIINAFLTFLNVGQVEITGDNVMVFYQLADEHKVDSLLELCYDFIESQLDIDNLESMFALSVDTNDLKLMLLCLNFAGNNRDDLNLKEFFEKVRLVFEKKPKIIRALLMNSHLNVPKNDEDFTSFLNSLSGELILTKDNIWPLALLSHWINQEKLSSTCAFFIFQNLNMETFPEILKLAVDFNLKDIVWKCLQFAQSNEYQLKRFEGFHGQPYEDFANVIEVQNNLQLIDDTGSIVCSKELQSLIFVEKLCSYFKVNLTIVQYGDSDLLKEVSNLCPSITNLSVDCPIDIEVSPILEKFHSLRGFENMRNINSFDQLQKYAAQFSPVNKKSNINLTGIGIFFPISDDELKSFLQKFTRIISLNIFSSKISKIPFPERLFSLIFSGDSLVGSLVLPSAKYVDVKHTKIKIIWANEAGSIVICDNPELISVVAPKAIYIACLHCEKLKNMIIPNTCLIEKRALW